MKAICFLVLTTCLVVPNEINAEPLFDAVSSGYVFLADRPKEQNPTETQWITNELEDVLAGVMWEEHRPVREIELVAAAAARSRKSRSSPRLCG